MIEIRQMNIDENGELKEFMPATPLVIVTGKQIGRAHV